MDTTAYLRLHGWQGAGHRLNPHSKHGLNKPLHVEQKMDVLGLGKRKHDTLIGQWWAKAFDDVLRDVNHQDKDGCESKNVSAGGLPMTGGALTSGSMTRSSTLYGSFVKGEGLQGTIATRASHNNLKSESGGSGSVQHGEKHSQVGDQLLLEKSLNQPTLRDGKKDVGLEIDPLKGCDSTAVTLSGARDLSNNHARLYEKRRRKGERRRKRRERKAQKTFKADAS